MASLQVSDELEGLQIWRAAAKILNKQSRTTDKIWSSSLGVGRGVTTPRLKNKFVTKIHKMPRKSLILREERRLRVFENRVLRRIFDPKRDEVMGDWRKLHNEELHNSPPNTNRIIESRR
jgi:hypothetical protein